MPHEFDRKSPGLSLIIDSVQFRHSEHAQCLIQLLLSTIAGFCAKEFVAESPISLSPTFAPLIWRRIDRVFVRQGRDSLSTMSMRSPCGRRLERKIKQYIPYQKKYPNVVPRPVAGSSQFGSFINAVVLTYAAPTIARRRGGDAYRKLR